MADSVGVEPQVNPCLRRDVIFLCSKGKAPENGLTPACAGKQSGISLTSAVCNTG